MIRSPFARSQRMPILLGMLFLVLIIVVLQLWLFTATMEAYLGGDSTPVIPAALASLTCFGLVLGLLRYLRALDR
ncbi:MAG TPA: DUF6755 family protein [Bacillota bacterium]|nr:DUF6755 family protein [Bacillota bacterium]